MIDKVTDLYKGIFRLWADTYVPRLIYRPSKWNKDDENLKKGDLVYFKKDPGTQLSSKWVIGMIDEVLVSRDGKARKVAVKYVNENENKPRITERATRSLVKIYDIEEYVLQEDLAEVFNRINEKQHDPVQLATFPTCSHCAAGTHTKLKSLGNVGTGTEVLVSVRKII